MQYYFTISIRFPLPHKPINGKRLVWEHRWRGEMEKQREMERATGKVKENEWGFLAAGLVRSAYTVFTVPY